MKDYQAIPSRNCRRAEGNRSLTSHHCQFLDCVWSGARPNAEAEADHLSTSLAHSANFATLGGRALSFDPTREAFLQPSAAHAWLGGT